MRRGLALALVAVGCAADEPWTLRGEHVDLVISPGQEPCGDLVGHMDRYVALAADRWGVDLTGRRYQYYWQTWSEFLTSGCTKQAVGCARDDRTHAWAAPLDHELLHNVSFAVGRPPSFFIEGAARAFELDSTALTGEIDPRPGAEDLAEAMVTRAPLPGALYTLAGAYTRLLIDRFGMAAYLEFYAALAPERDLEAIAAVHLASFGEPLDATIAAFDATRRDCPFSRYNFKMFECSQPALAWDGDVLTTEHDLACDGGEAIGPFFSGAGTRVYTRFTVAEAGVFEVASAGPTGVVIRLGSCGGCEAAPDVLFAPIDGPRRVALAAGDHLLQMTGSPTSDRSVTVRIERVAE